MLKGLLNDEGHEVDIRSVDLEQNRMVVNFTADEGQKALVLRGEIHGDRLVGAGAHLMRQGLRVTAWTQEEGL